MVLTFSIYLIIIISVSGENKEQNIPVCSFTSSFIYLRLPVSQSKYLRVTGNHPRRTANSQLHNTLNIEPIRVIICRLTANFFAHCPSHPNTLVTQIVTYTPADCTDMYRKYTNIRGLEF